MSQSAKGWILAGLLLALLAGVLTSGGYVAGYAKAQSDTRAKLSDMQDELNEKARLLREIDSKKETVIVTETVEVIKEVKVKGDTIIKEVPVYVTKEADSACTVPLGFVSVHDRAIHSGNAAQAQAAAPAADAGAPEPQEPVPQWRNEPSGVPLSEVAAVSAHNATAFGQLKSMYLGLRQWATTQCYGP